MGQGGFTCSDVSTDANTSADVTLGDVDSDGNVDAVFANSNQGNRLCLGNGLGGFTCGDLSTDVNLSLGVALGDFTVNGVNQPPDCSGAAPSVAEIWPPNHKFVGVNIVGVTDPDGDPVTITVTKITQDEPLNTFGDGNFEPDGGGLGTSTAQVRAERSGSKKVPGNGRVYEISFTAEDGNGGKCSASVTVCVPHDQRKGHVCIDDGQDFNSVTGGTPKLTVRADNLVEKATLPDGYELLQNYPNPFNPTTEIAFGIPEAGEVKLTIYNLSGQLVRTLVSGQLSAGNHRVTWNATDDRGQRVASGIYLYVLKAGSVTIQKKLTLMK